MSDRYPKGYKPERRNVAAVIDYEVYRALQQAADDDHRTLSGVIRKILTEWAKAHPARP